MRTAAQFSGSHQDHVTHVMKSRTAKKLKPHLMSRGNIRSWSSLKALLIGNTRNRPVFEYFPWQEVSSHTMSLIVCSPPLIRCTTTQTNHDWIVIQVLTIISFFFFLSLAEWISAKMIRAGIVGQIAVGIIYGVPLADILKVTWQETFLAIGYIGLILIIFEGNGFKCWLYSVGMTLT